jgi:Aspartyl protease
MMRRQRIVAVGILCVSCALGAGEPVRADVPLGGFIPLVGVGLTREFQDADDDDFFFIADAKSNWSGTPTRSYFDIALLDTGAATHIFTQTAANSTHFGLHVPFSGEPDGFGGTNFQSLFGATGTIELRINDPLGVYIEGMSHRTSNGGPLTLDTSAMRGQTSVATLEAPAEWKLPNIIGLPMAAQHGIVIRNSQPQVFPFTDGTTTRTVRTPDINLIELGTGGAQGISRRTNLRLNPSASFLGGPLYIQNLDFQTLTLHENPLSPTVIDSGGLYIEVDVTNEDNSVQDKQILFDTGADLTVFSEVFAASLGLDILTKTPDFHLEVEGSGGIEGGVPGYYVDQIKIDSVGGAIVLNNVPIAVLDVPNPTAPANIIDAILGMNLFTGRDLVIDAVPAASGSGNSPRLYISDPVTETHTWSAPTATGSWATAANWTSASTTPGNLWIADVRNTGGSDKTANVSANSLVFQMNVTATSTGQMVVQVEDGASLTVFGETRIDTGGVINVAPTARLDAQVVNIQGGTLAGSGTVFVGSGPINGVVRNLSGRVAPGQFGTAGSVGLLTITGDFSNLLGGTLAIDLAGTAASQYDRIAANRFAFLSGTLEVSLAGFTPAVGNTFTLITATQGVNGQFENLLLPAGFQWDVAYGSSNVVLSVVGIGLTGDFNADNKVDMADYVVWRKTGGSPQNYQLWRSQYGIGVGSGTGSSFAASIPEPASALLTALAASVFALCRPRRLNSQTARS